MNKKHLGSNFDDFLAEEGLLEEAETVGVKRVLAYQINQEMKEQNISKTEMARRMQTSRAALERLLDPENPSVTLLTMEKAAHSLGKKIRLTLV